MTNKYKWSLLVYSEDDATHQLANGLVRAYVGIEDNVQIMPYARGWTDAVEQASQLDMLKYPQRHILMIIDFDEEDNRASWIKSQYFPDPNIQGRVFILGAFTQAEDLKQLPGMNENNLEKIGRKLARDCSFWGNKYLGHCKAEACRLQNEIDKPR